MVEFLLSHFLYLDLSGLLDTYDLNSNP
jgi:hypothetical protein